MELYAQRGYFFCRYCGSFHFPETAGDNGIRVLSDSAEGLECPGCTKPLATGMLDDVHAVHYCRNCRGVLLPRRTFAEVVRVRRAWAGGTPTTPVPPTRHELERRVACPNCRTLMLVHPYYGPGNVVMDSCEGCDAVWLDFGELKQIVDAPGADRGRRDVPQRSAADPDAWQRRPKLDAAVAASGEVPGLLAVFLDIFS